MTNGTHAYESSRPLRRQVFPAAFSLALHFSPYAAALRPCSASCRWRWRWRWICSFRSGHGLLRRVFALETSGRDWRDAAIQMHQQC